MQASLRLALEWPAALIATSVDAEPPTGPDTVVAGGRSFAQLEEALDAISGAAAISASRRPGFAAASRGF
jgi:hypothetical protein